MGTWTPRPASPETQAYAQGSRQFFRPHSGADKNSTALSYFWRFIACLPEFACLVLHLRLVVNSFFSRPVGRHTHPYFGAMHSIPRVAYPNV